MNVVVNGRFLERRITGVERYGREILRRLGGSHMIVRSGKWSNGMRGHLWEQVALPGQVGSDHVLWSPANTGPLRVENQVLTLHDLSPLEHPDWYQPAFALWYRIFLPPLVLRVGRVVVPSEFIKAKLLRRFCVTDGHVVVIPGGVDTGRFYPGAERRLDLPERYVLFVGSLQPRKNLPRLLDAWQQMKETASDTWLVIAGTGSDIFRPIKLTKGERVIFLGPVSESDLPGLYAHAALFVLPSLDEGFGLPMLEAMASGTPLAVSRAGALPEVVGGAGLTFDPMDITEMADALRCGLTDIPLQNSLREKGLMRARCFSWQDSADKMWKIFGEYR